MLIRFAIQNGNRNIFGIKKLLFAAIFMTIQLFSGDESLVVSRAIVEGKEEEVNFSNISIVLF